MSGEFVELRDRRDDLTRIIAGLDALAGDVLRLRVMYATALALHDFEAAGVPRDSAEVVGLIEALRGLYEGLDFSLIEEWIG